MAFVLVTIFGFIALYELPVELFPPMDQPVFQVRTDYKVNNYKIIEQNVSKRIERQLSSIDGVIFTESVSFPNYSLVTVYLDWQTDVTSVLLDAREKLDQTLLPIDADRPLLEKVDPSRFPVFSYLIKGRPVETLSKLVENHLGRVFDQVDGIAEAQFIGTRERRVIVRPKEDVLRSYNLSLMDIQEKLNAIPQTSSGAVIRDGFREWSLRINDFISNVNQITDIKIKKVGSRYVTIGDVATIHFDYERANEFVVSGHEQGILVHLIKESKANLISSADNVYEQIKKLEAFYPDLTFTPIFDGANEIKSAIQQLVLALAVGGMLSFVILIFSFKSFRVPLYLAIIIPVSILGTFIGCWFFNVSFNLISLGGLGLGIGMLIDNGIIITEHVKQRIGLGIQNAVSESIRTLWLPMLTSTLTSLSVFLPLLTVGGMSAVLFKQQAITISLSLGWAYIVAITLLPLLIILFPPEFKETNSFKNRNWTLQGLRRPQMSLTLLIFSVIALPLSVYFMNKRLLPDGKSNKLLAAYSLDQFKTSDQVITHSEEINKRLQEEGFNPIIYVTEEKEFSADRWLNVEIPIASSEEKEHTETLLKSILEGPWEIRYEKALLRQIVDERQDYHNINVLTRTQQKKNELTQFLKPYQNEIEIIGNSSRLYLILDLDREKLMTHNLNINRFVSFLETQLSGDDVGEIKSFNRTDKIILSGNYDERREFSSLLKSKYFQNGIFYKTSDFVSWRIEEQSEWTLAVNQSEVMMIRKSIYDDHADEFMEELKEKLGAEGFVFTNDITSFRISETNNQLAISLIFSLILILFILAVQFETLRHPILIVSIVPLSFSGAFLALWLLGESVNVIALTGLVILMGIVINDTILKIDAIRSQRKKGYHLLRSILKGSHSRLRAIILTTLSTVVASVPLLFGAEGIELRKPLAIVLIAGMLFSTYLTIQLVPVLYYRFIKND